MTMTIINGRYRVVEEISKDYLGTIYRCYDNIQNIKVIIRVLNSGVLKGVNISKIVSSLSQLRSFRHPNVYDIFDFAVLKGFDSSGKDANRYYYVYEDFGYESAIDYKTLTKEEVIIVIKQILMALKFFNFKELSYKYLNFENIQICKINGQIVVKLRNLLFMDYLSDAYYSSMLMDFFAAPEVVWENASIPQSDVYSFGAVLYYLYYGYDYNEKAFGDVYLEYGKNDLIDLVIDMTKKDPMERIDDIHEVAKELSTMLEFEMDGSDEKYYFDSSNDIKLVGREPLLRDILGNIESYFSGSNNIQSAFIAGSKGIGKTKLLKELEFSMGIQGIDAFSYEHIEYKKKGIFLSLANSIISKSEIPFYILRRYGYDLANISPEIRAKYGISGVMRERYSGYDSSDRDQAHVLCSFLADFSKYNPFVFIVDSSEELTPVDSVIFHNILNRVVDSNIYILYIGDEEVKNRNYIKNWVKSGIISRYGLVKLTESQSDEFITHMLGNTKCDSLCFKYIYKITEGVPSKLKQLLSEMYKSGIMKIVDGKYYDLSKVSGYICANLGIEDIDTIPQTRLSQKKEDIFLLKKRLKSKDFINTLLRIGDAEIDEKRYDEAVEVYDLAYKELTPDLGIDFELGVKFKYAKALMMSGNGKVAMTLSNEIAESARENKMLKLELEALWIQMKLYEKENELEKKRKECYYALNQATLINDEYLIMEFQYFIAGIEYELGELEKVIDILEDSLESYGDNASNERLVNCYILIASSILESDYSSEKGFDYLTKAIDILENDSNDDMFLKTKMFLAKSLISVDRYKDAILILMSSMEIMSDKMFSHMEQNAISMLCRCYSTLNEYAKAYTIVKKIEAKILEEREKDIFNYDYSIACIDYYISILNIDKAEYFLFDAYNNFNLLTQEQKFEIEVKRFLVKYRRDNRMTAETLLDFKVIEDFENKVMGPADAKILRGVLIHIALSLLSSKKFIAAQGVIEVDDRLTKKYDSEFFRTKSMIVSGMLEDDRLGAYNRILLLRKDIITHEDFWHVNKILAEEYFSKGITYLAINSALVAFRSVKRLNDSIHPYFREDYILTDQSKIDLKSLIVRISIKYSSLIGDTNTYNKVFFSATVSEYFDFDQVNLALKDRNYIQNIFNSYYLKSNIGISDYEQMVSYMKGDSIQNIKIALSYCIQKLAAERGYLYILDEKYNVIDCISSDMNADIPDISKLAIGMDLTREYLLLNSNDTEFSPLNEWESGKTVLLFPLRTKSQNADLKDYIGFNMLKNSLIDQKILFSYAYIETGMIYNNFGHEVVDELRPVMNLLRIIIENYYTKRISQIDPKTGLYNRDFISDEISLNMLRANHKEEIFSIAMCDVFNIYSSGSLKMMKDNEGLIDEVISAIKDSLSYKVTFGRLNYNEFILVFPRQSSEEACELLTNIGDNLKKQMLSKYGVNVRLCFGVVEFPKHSLSKQGLIEKAENALYYAKEREDKDGNCVTWNPVIDETPMTMDRVEDLVTGDISSDSRMIYSFAEIFKVFRNSSSNSIKLSKILDIVMDLTGAGICDIYEMIPGRGIVRTMHKRSNSMNETYNEGGVYEVDMVLIEKCMYSDNIKKYINWGGDDQDQNSEIPKWYSFLIAPLISSGISKGALVLSTTLFTKEFNNYDTSLVASVSGIIATLME